VFVAGSWILGDWENKGLFGENVVEKLIPFRNGYIPTSEPFLFAQLADDIAGRGGLF
jgi:hypothetical protein